MRSFELPAVGGIPCPQCGHEIPVGHLTGEEIDRAATAEVHFADEDEEGFAVQLRRSLSKKARFVCGKCGRGLKVETLSSGCTRI